jgi:hypothetical protein
MTSRIAGGMSTGKLNAADDKRTTALRRREIRSPGDTPGCESRLSQWPSFASPTCAACSGMLRNN